ncbi:hypothetical protein ACFQY8_01370 [Alloscardovia venturai]|uniref:Uncharacterized protein n=1 Tax=Alloscardovia venturai TaxID=1769421 RepID=A0ABW2Y3Q2_9BIFI
MIAPMYKVYPTKNPDALFTMFPDGFEIEQIYTTANNQSFDLDVFGKSENHSITGELSRYHDDDGYIKISDVSYQDGHFVFSNPKAAKDWPLSGFLFQRFTLNQKLLNTLNVERPTSGFYYNFQIGEWDMEYDLKSSKVCRLFDLEDNNIKHFVLSGEDWTIDQKRPEIRPFVKKISFDFTDNTYYSERIEQEIL